MRDFLLEPTDVLSLIGLISKIDRDADNCQPSVHAESG
jgi:hypothetical protein